MSVPILISTSEDPQHFSQHSEYRCHLEKEPGRVTGGSVAKTAQGGRWSGLDPLMVPISRDGAVHGNLPLGLLGSGRWRYTQPVPRHPACSVPAHRAGGSWALVLAAPEVVAQSGGSSPGTCGPGKPAWPGTGGVRYRLSWGPGQRPIPGLIPSPTAGANRLQTHSSREARILTHAVLCCGTATKLLSTPQPTDLCNAL